MAKKKNTRTKVESIRHKNKRTNIPTEELRDFVADEELVPKTMLYPRDSSLDPQLVWKGKDEQDREDLAVPVVPVYIQEKIHSQAIIDALPRIEHTGELAALYPQRWEIETAFDELKTHLRGSKIVLRSKTPELVRQEFWGLLLAHFAIRDLMQEAAHKGQQDPDQLSYVHAVRLVRRKLAIAVALPPSG